jgi:hypothetical protein
MMIKKLLTILLMVSCSSLAYAHDVKALSDSNLKYFVIQGVAKPEMIKRLLENPADPWVNAVKMTAGIKGAKLIDYYMEAGAARNLAIIAVPDTKYAAAIVYQRMGTLFMEDMTVFEVIPSSKFKEVLEIANELNKSDSYLKK